MTGNEGARQIWWVACAGALALGLMPTPTAAGDVVNAKMADLEATMELVMRQSGGLARGDAGGDAGRAGEADASNLISALDTLDSKPYMTDDEVAFLWRYLTAGAIDHYFEFGCGGSSLLAAAVPSIGNITCVDSDRKWIAVRRSYRAIGWRAGPGGRWAAGERGSGIGCGGCFACCRTELVSLTCVHRSESCGE